MVSGRENACTTNLVVMLRHNFCNKLESSA